MIDAVKTIKREHNKDEWEHGNDEIMKILLFLYSRGASNKCNNPNDRCTCVNEMLAEGQVRERMLQVISVEADSDISLNEGNQEHFISTCLTLHRCFRQNGATCQKWCIICVSKNLATVSFKQHV